MNYSLLLQRSFLPSAACPPHYTSIARPTTVSEQKAVKHIARNDRFLLDSRHTKVECTPHTLVATEKPRSIQMSHTKVVPTGRHLSGIHPRRTSFLSAVSASHPIIKRGTHTSQVGSSSYSLICWITTATADKAQLMREFHPNNSSTAVHHSLRRVSPPVQLTATI